VTWKLTLEYDGTRYSGWQEQTNARTIMGELRKAAEDYFGERVDIQGSGRTDAGVHAAMQIAHLRVRTTKRHQPKLIRYGLNDRLPADIVVIDAQEIPAAFHARHDAVSRQYVYRISTRKTAFHKRVVWWVKDDLDVDAMQRACELLPGRHDFRCFRAADVSRPDESTIVIVEHAGIEIDDHLIVLRIRASHFLWRMVRRIVGVLVKIGAGAISLDDLRELLDGHCSARLDVAAWTAPASGLMLEEVVYPEESSFSSRSSSPSPPPRKLPPRPARRRG
jgi:tRNA pseudouridine38-40 synthase